MTPEQKERQQMLMMIKSDAEKRLITHKDFPDVVKSTQETIDLCNEALKGVQP